MTAKRRDLSTRRTRARAAGKASPHKAAGANSPASKKMSTYRARLRAAGLRPIQIWVPDVSSPDFVRKLKSQIKRLPRNAERETLDFLEAVAAEDLT